MGMTIHEAGAWRALPLTLSPLPRAGEGNVRCRAARDGLVSSKQGALEWK